MGKATPWVVRSPAAIGDIVEVADYIAQTTSLAAADRFIAATDKTLRATRRDARRGHSRYEPDDPAYAEMRYFPISRFRNYLVFYRPMLEDIEVVRVLHGARDIAAIFDEEE